MNVNAKSFQEKYMVSPEYVAKKIKVKILTTYIQVVRIFLCAPDRTQAISLYLIDFQIFADFL